MMTPNWVGRTALCSGLAVSLAACDSSPPSTDGDGDQSVPETVAITDSRPATDIVAAIGAGTLTAEEAVRNALARIDARDDDVQAVLALNPDAVSQAQAIDVARTEESAPVGRLQGVPVLVKDNIETADQATTAGSLALLANDTGRDAPIIARLRAEGAIILGKTNLSEWANFRSTDSISGWSGVGGQTRNPWSLDRSPCGSSSGSGAAVAAGYVPLAIGTETNGSILCPSAMNGIVGLKPTVGLLPRTHIVPISSSQDTAGPMARNVADAAIMLGVMAGSDDADPATAEADARSADYTESLDGDLTDMTIGVLRFAAGPNDAVVAAFDTALGRLEAAGATLIEIEEAPELPDAFFPDGFFLLQAEFKTTLEDYLADAAPAVTVRTLPDLIAFNEAESERELALFNQDIVSMSEETGGTTNERYDAVRATLREAARTNGIEKLLADSGATVLVAPSRPPAFLIDAVYGDSYPGGTGADYLAAIGGTPNLTVPMDLVRGLPVGISFMGAAWGEAEILRAGYAFEQQRGPFPRPTFATSAFTLSATEEALRPLPRPSVSDLE